VCVHVKIERKKEQQQYKYNTRRAIQKKVGESSRKTTTTPAAGQLRALSARKKKRIEERIEIEIDLISQLTSSPLSFPPRPKLTFDRGCNFCWFEKHTLATLRICTATIIRVVTIITAVIPHMATTTSRGKFLNLSSYVPSAIFVPYLLCLILSLIWISNSNIQSNFSRCKNR